MSASDAVGSGESFKRLSIVVPVYNEERILPDTVSRILALRHELPTFRIDLIFVDDGSRDRSVEVLRELSSEDGTHITIVKLTRNFGSFAAIQAGLSAATGDCIGIIAADLQDPPELFPEMIKHWEAGTKAVFAVRAQRDDSAGEKMFARIYYTLMRKFAIPEYPQGGFDFVLIDGSVAREIVEIREKNTNLMSLIFWLGHCHVLIPYTRSRRTKGTSAWSLAKKAKLFIDSFVAFSYVPIRLLSVIGLLFAAGAFAYGCIVFVAWMAGGVTVEGWSALMTFITFTAGIQMTMLGVLGEYLWRVLDEVRRRPSFVVEEIVTPQT